MFQIWINLPKAKKMCSPHFAMLWSESIPRHTHQDVKNKKTEVTVIAGHLFETKGLPPALILGPMIQKMKYVFGL